MFPPDGARLPSSISSRTSSTESGESETERSFATSMSSSPAYHRGRTSVEKARSGEARGVGATQPGRPQLVCSDAVVGKGLAVELLLFEVRNPRVVLRVGLSGRGEHRSRGSTDR